MALIYIFVPSFFRKFLRWNVSYPACSLVTRPCYQFTVQRSKVEMLSIADRHPLFKWCGLIFQSGTCCLSKIQGTSDLGGSNKHSGVSKGILFTKSVFWRKRENCPSQKLYLALFFFFPFRSFLPIGFMKYTTFTLIRVLRASALWESLTRSTCVKQS